MPKHRIAAAAQNAWFQLQFSMRVVLCIKTRWISNKESSDFHNILVAASINLIKLPNW